jgi:hypothetical protein
MEETGHIDGMGAPVSGPRCRLCGESIGVYEPLVAVEWGRARKTSRAAEAEIATTPGEYWHLACHEHLCGTTPGATADTHESPLAG